MYKNIQNQKLVTSTTAIMQWDEATAAIVLSGDWVWAAIDERIINESLTNLKPTTNIVIDATGINELDTCGMYFIQSLIVKIELSGAKLQALNLPSAYEKMFTLIERKLKQEVSAYEYKKKSGGIAKIGAFFAEFYAEIVAFVAFFGYFCLSVLSFLKNPFSLKWSEVSRTINDAGAKGMWVVALLCFLIGITLAYEMSPQFVTYGANVYIVNFLGIALLKEVAPLLSAVIVAGRTGASITAEIGTQKLQEEIDAIKTMGISPMQRIVLPKVIGVMIAVPLITSVGDIMSMLGGAIAAKPMLGVSYSLFLERVQVYVETSNYTSGIIKSVAFAMLIALGGCFCGFKVEGNANSIGEKTTNSVVLGIVLVIFCDAVFAVIFNAIGW